MQSWTAASPEQCSILCMGMLCLQRSTRLGRALIRGKSWLQPACRSILLVAS